MSGLSNEQLHQVKKMIDEAVKEAILEERIRMADAIYRQLPQHGDYHAFALRVISECFYYRRDDY